MISSHESVSGGDLLPPEEFLEHLETTHECFPMVGGIFGGRGETEAIEIADYHAPMTDFFSDPDLRRHLTKISENRPATATIPLEVGTDFKYAFDNGEEWFRVGRGAFLHVAGRKVPVRVVRLDFAQFSLSWLYRDERDVE